jgi:serine/threonine-protein kinase RsbW
VIPQAVAGSDLNCAFFLDQDTLRVAVAAECDSPRPPSQDGFAWTVLAALTTSVAAEVEGNRLTIKLSRTTTEPE